MHEMLFETIDNQRLIVRRKKETLFFELADTQAKNTHTLTFNLYEFKTLLRYIRQANNRTWLPIVTVKGMGFICSMDTGNT